MTMESDIHAWILNSLSHNLEEFNNMPACPYAKQALVDNKVKCVEINSVFGDDVIPYQFLAELENFSYQWPKGIEVVVLGCNPDYISALRLTEIAEQANSTFLKTRGYLVLEDHPSVEESVAGYVVNQGAWALLLLQSRKKVIAARKILEKRGYYKNWDPEYYTEVVSDRS
jgi:hypothetical protein